jgi:hypothetical protein
VEPAGLTVYERPVRVRFDKNGAQRLPFGPEELTDFGVFIKVRDAWWKEDPFPLSTEFGPWELAGTKNEGQ